MKPRLRRWQAKRIQYNPVMRNGEWWIVETSRYGEAWRGPFPTRAKALARLKEYGPQEPKSLARPLDHFDTYDTKKP
jgi:hypothetical protein